MPESPESDSRWQHWPKLIPNAVKQSSFTGLSLHLQNLAKSGVNIQTMSELTLGYVELPDVYQQSA